MTWYQKKTAEIFGNMQNHQSIGQSSIISMTITIINMKTDEDYQIIKEGLKELEGVYEIYPYFGGKLTVTFDQNRTNLENIVYKISKLGYRYINRF